MTVSAVTMKNAKIFSQLYRKCINVLLLYCGYTRNLLKDDADMLRTTRIEFFSWLYKCGKVIGLTILH